MKAARLLATRMVEARRRLPRVVEARRRLGGGNCLHVLRKNCKKPTAILPGVLHRLKRPGISRRSHRTPPSFWREWRTLRITALAQRGAMPTNNEKTKREGKPNYCMGGGLRRANSSAEIHNDTIRRQSQMRTWRTDARWTCARGCRSFRWRWPRQLPHHKPKALPSS